MKNPFASKSAIASRQPVARSIQITNPWHAVVIHSSGSACPLCKALGSARYLAREAPSVPVIGCLHPAICRSVYRHFDDRRDGPRRDAEQEYPSRRIPQSTDPERRQMRGVAAPTIIAVDLSST